MTIVAAATATALAVGEAAAAVGAGFMAALPAALGGTTGAIGAGTGIGAGTAAGAGAAAAAGAGGISAGAGGIAGSIGAGLSGIAQGAVLGSGLGAITSAATGGDVGKGAAMGAATGAIGGGLTSAVGEIGAGIGTAADEAGSTIGSTTSEIAPVAEDAGSATVVEPIATIADQAPLGEATPFFDETVPNSINVSPMRLAGGPTPPTGGITSVGADMTPAEMSSAIRTPSASTDLGTGSYGGNTAAINAVNATPPVAAPTPPASSGLGQYIDKGINYIKDNPAVAIQAGGAALSMMGGSNQQENAPEPVYPYTPSTYTPPPIEKTSVPQYYNPTGSYGYTGGYAEGGVINSAQPNGSMMGAQPNGFMNNTQPNGFMNNTQPNGAMNGAQPNGPMNPIVARSIEQVKSQQAQQSRQGQQSQMPTTPPPAPQGIMGAQTQPQFIVLPQQQQQQQPMGQSMGSMPQPVGQFTQPPMGQPAGENVSQPTQMAAHGGMMRDNLGGYSHGGIAGLTRGPGTGISDSIPAEIGDSGKQPARLADGEFVVPSRIVSELGQGSTEAGAKMLQAMVNKIQARRSKTIGKGKVASNSKANKELLA